jgi:hypothetical protein
VIRAAIISVLVVISTTKTPYAEGNASSQYCAQFSDGTSPSCSFVTLAQCEESISGVGGICNINPATAYQPPLASPVQGLFLPDPLAIAPPLMAAPPPRMAEQPSPSLSLPDAPPPDLY